jgi:HTH-type transcriptional regulator/antitoxin HigA
VKPIHSTEDHAAALGRIATLWDVSNDSPEADELEVLSVLVSEYEREHFPVNPDGGYKLPDVFTF